MSTNAGREEESDEFEVDEEGFFFFFDVEVPVVDEEPSVRFARTGEVVAELVDFLGTVEVGLELYGVVEVVCRVGRGWKVVEGEVGFEEEVEEDEDVGRFEVKPDPVLRVNDGNGVGLGGAIGGAVEIDAAGDSQRRRGQTR